MAAGQAHQEAIDEGAPRSIGVGAKQGGHHEAKQVRIPALCCGPVDPEWRSPVTPEAAAGGFSGETLAENTDLTLAMGRMGYRVEYAPQALAYTEAPQTLRGLARQRSRWAFGMLQCFWKHRRGLFSPRARAFGLVAIPGLALAQLVMP